MGGAFLVALPEASFSDEAVCSNAPSFFIFPLPASVPASVFFSAFFFSFSPESACTFLSFTAASVSLDIPCVAAPLAGNFCAAGCCVLQNATPPTSNNATRPTAALRLPGFIRKSYQWDCSNVRSSRAEATLRSGSSSTQRRIASVSEPRYSFPSSAFNVMPTA